MSSRMRYRASAAIALALAASTAFAQGAPQAPPSSKAVVLKGKAPVNEKVLEVKLPKPREGDLSNGIHLIVLEDRLADQVMGRVRLCQSGRLVAGQAYCRGLDRIGAFYKLAVRLSLLCFWVHIPNPPLIFPLSRVKTRPVGNNLGT